MDQAHLEGGASDQLIRDDSQTDLVAGGFLGRALLFEEVHAHGDLLASGESDTPSALAEARLAPQACELRHWVVWLHGLDQLWESYAVKDDASAHEEAALADLQTYLDLPD